MLSSYLVQNKCEALLIDENRDHLLKFRITLSLDTFLKWKLLAYLGEISSIEFFPVHLPLFTIFINSKQGRMFKNKTSRLSSFSDSRNSHQISGFTVSSSLGHLVQAKGPFLFLIISKCRLPTYFKAGLSLWSYTLTAHFRYFSSTNG